MGSTDLDARDLGRHVTIEVHVTHTKEVVWRMRLLSLLLWLASKIAPLKLTVVEPAPSTLLYCPYCKHDNCVQYWPGIQWEQCHYCGRQFMVRDGVVVGEPPACDHECAYVEPFGYVPEGGCPTHDVGK